MLVGDSCIGQALGECFLGEARLPRERIFPNIQNFVDLSLFETRNEGIDAQSFIACGVDRHM